MAVTQLSELWQVIRAGYMDTLFTLDGFDHHRNDALVMLGNIFDGLNIIKRNSDEAMN